MKLDEFNADKDKIVKVDEQQVKKLKHVSSVRHIPGHTLFECDIATRTIRVAEMETYFDLAKNVQVRRVKQKENTLYAEALNMKNAKKKFIKMFRSVIENATNKRI